MEYKQSNNQNHPAILVCNQLLVYIDHLLSRQVNLILHHPKFQKLEATWTGLSFLLQHQEEGHNLKIRILDLSWEELSKDLYNALEFDQSQLFRKIYGNEFDQPGGEPFGLLICDHSIQLKPSQGSLAHNDIQTLLALSGVAAAAFAPCVLGVEAEFFGLDRYSDFESLRDLKKIFSSSDYDSWKYLRNHPDARFLNLVLPRVTMRLPYRLGDNRIDGFCFEEECTRHEDYLWGNPAYALAATIIRSFCQTSWFLNIKGIDPSLSGGGTIESLPPHYYDADASPSYAKPLLEVSLKTIQEMDLNNFGFMTLSICQYTSTCIFYTCPTVYGRASSYEKIDFVSAELFYYPLYNILVISRFAHYLKVIGRNKVGSFLAATQYEYFLQNWIGQYTGQPSGDMTQEFISKYPLAESTVRITETPGYARQHYLCTISIRPHTHIQEYDDLFLFNLKLPKLT
jgi:type VI secretion system protein ImpD